MTTAAIELPDDIEALKALVLAARSERAVLAAEAAALRAAKADADARIERLHALLKTLEWARYGRRSEPLDPDQHAFAFEEVETGADKTTLPTLAPGTGKTKTAWLWAYARDDRPFGGTGPPMVAYRFEDGRGGACPARHLAGFSGLLQIDGYAAYRALTDANREGGPVSLAACWAHLRRKFYELHAANLSETATWTVERMAALCAIEQEVSGCDPDARRSARQRIAAPVVAELFERWEAELRRIPGNGKLPEAIRYALRRREDLARFLDDGRIELDTNIVERAIRPQTITRKNALFAGSDGGGRTSATIATLLATAKLNGFDPYAWLKITLERIADGWPNRDIDDLMPWNYAQT